VNSVPRSSGWRVERRRPPGRRSIKFVEGMRDAVLESLIPEESVKRRSDRCFFQACGGGYLAGTSHIRTKIPFSHSASNVIRSAEKHAVETGVSPVDPGQMIQNSKRRVHHYPERIQNQCSRVGPR